MRSVVLKEQKEVSIDEITDNSIVGMQWNDKTKGYIFKYSEGVFKGIDLCDLTPEYNHSRGSKKEYAMGLINESEAKVFLFDSKEEIIEWLKS